MQKPQHITIIGAGVAGLTAAKGLSALGYKIDIFESAAELKGIGAGFGLAANAIQAFEYLGLQEVLELGHLIADFNIFDDRGKILIANNARRITQKYQQDNFAIHRATLHQFLLSKIDPKQLHLGKKALQFEKLGPQIKLNFEDGTSHFCDYLIVADGVKSRLRQQLLPQSTPRYAGYTCWRATIENTAHIALKATQEIWGAKGRFGMTPLKDNKIYWYACINSRANNPIYKHYSVADLAQHFANYAAPIPTLLAQTTDAQLIWNDIIDIKPLEHLAYDNILLIGDAGHATTPNMGQGACQAIEDVAVLVDQLKDTPDIRQAFRNFEHRRVARTRYITETSWWIGKAAQWESPIAIALRNMILRCLPSSALQYNIKKLLSVDFMKINKQS